MLQAVLQLPHPLAAPELLLAAGFVAAALPGGQAQRVERPRTYDNVDEEQVRLEEESHFQRQRRRWREQANRHEGYRLDDHELSRILADGAYDLPEDFEPGTKPGAFDIAYDRGMRRALYGAVSFVVFSFSFFLCVCQYTERVDARRRKRA